MDINNFFDLDNILVNEIVGSIWLFLFIGMIVILIVCIRNKIPYQVAILLCVIYTAAVVSNNMGLSIIWTLMVLVVGALFYYSQARVLRRG